MFQLVEVMNGMIPHIPKLGTCYYNGGVNNNYSIEFSLDNDQSVGFGNFQLPTTYFSVQFLDLKPNLDFNSEVTITLKPLVVARPDDNQDVRSLYLMTTEWN